MIASTSMGNLKQENGHAFQPLFDVEDEADEHIRLKGRPSQDLGRRSGEDRDSMETARPFRPSTEHSFPYPYPSINANSISPSPSPLPFPHRLASSMDDDPDSMRRSFEVMTSSRPDEMELKRRRARWLKDTAITGIFVLLWYLFATLLSIYNKWMFSPEYYGFSYPLFVTTTHMCVQFFLASLVRVIWKQYRPKEIPSRRDYGMKVIPTAVATGADIGLSNLSLKTITLTLYTMVKSSTLIFVLVFAFLFHLEVFSFRLLSVICFITLGVFLMVFNATTVSIPGIIMVFSASALGGLRWAFTQLLMHKKEMGMGNPFATIFWLTPVMAVTLAMVSMIVEGWGNIFGSEFFTGFKAVATTGFIVFPGTLAFAMVASEYFIIQRAGIVPLSIAGIFKEVTTITVSAWVFGDQLTPVNDIGVVITIGGIALYAYHKYQKQMQTPSDASEDDEEETIALQSSPRIKRQENGTAIHHVIGEQDLDDEDDDDDRIRTPHRAEVPQQESVQLLSVEDDTDWRMVDGEDEDFEGRSGKPPTYDGLRTAQE